MRVFISIPMKGKSDKRIKKELEQAKRNIIDEYHDVEFIDSFFDDADLTNPIKLLGKSIVLMADADMVYFCEGWEDARGCVIEHQVASAYGVECVYE